MALVFMDGLDCYTDLTDASRAGWQPESFSQLDFSTTAGRFGGGAFQFKNVITAARLSLPIVAYTGTIIIGFAYYHPGVADGILIEARSDLNTVAFQVRHTAAGAITLYSGVTLVHTSAGTPLTPNAWHWVEVKVVLNDSPTGSFEVRIDGMAAASFGSTDTRATGTGIAMIEFGGGGASTPNFAWMDDIVIMDGTATAPNDFIGDTKITTHVPTANAATADWTASAGVDYECVDEAPSAANGDTDYISSNTAAQESRFAISNLVNVPTTIHAVQVRSKAKKADAGTRTMRSLIRSGATELTGTEVGLTTEYAWIKGPVAVVDPDTAVAWSASGFNALEAGVEVVV